MTNFRSLCAELVEALDQCQRPCGEQPESSLVWKARAALAEAYEAEANNPPEGHPDPEPFQAILRERAAALAQPEPEEQVLARVEFAEREFNCPSDVVLRQYCDDWFYGDPERSEVDPVDLCRGAIKLFAQIPAPIPLSERLPGPEDCDARGGVGCFTDPRA